MTRSDRQGVQDTFACSPSNDTSIPGTITSLCQRGRGGNFCRKRGRIQDFHRRQDTKVWRKDREKRVGACPKEEKGGTEERQTWENALVSMEERGVLEWGKTWPGGGKPKTQTGEERSCKSDAGTSTSKVAANSRNRQLEDRWWTPPLDSLKVRWRDNKRAKCKVAHKKPVPFWGWKGRRGMVHKRGIKPAGSTNGM